MRPGWDPGESTKVLVAYASRYGSTKGIAEFVGEKLKARGFDVAVAEAGSAGDVGSFDAFVIGSAVYMYHWMKEARDFVLKNRRVLSSRPVWLFSSGPVGTKQVDQRGQDLLEASRPKEVEELTVATSANEHQVFFGALDGTKLSGATGFFYRMAKRSESAREAMPEGDFRDWPKIEAWANSIADRLEAPLSDRQRQGVPRPITQEPAIFPFGRAVKALKAYL